MQHGCGLGIGAMLNDRTVDLGVTLEEFYNVCIAGRRTEINALLARVAPSNRLSDPLAIGLRGMSAVVGGDVAGGVALLKRATNHSHGPTRQYLIDLLVPLLLNTNQMDDAEAVIDSITDPVAELIPAFSALRAQLAARRGEDALSERLSKDALAEGRALDNPLIVGRVLQRAGMAAFIRQDFDEAQERSLEAARWFERYEVYRHAANAYSVLYIIAHDWICDQDVSRYYARRMTMAANLAGDISTENHGLLCQLDIAAESGDMRRFGSIRGRLMANPLSEQYRAGRFGFAMSEALSQGWAGHFDVVRPQLLSLRKSASLSLPERALCDALMAIAAVATWQLDIARQMARRAISATAHEGGPEPLFEARRRRTARILAAAACIAIGDVTRGRRALSRKFDPDGRFRSLITRHGMDEIETPSLMRGYARFFNQACRSAKQIQPTLGLTPAELEILHALPQGETLDAIAKSMGKSRKTVERQTGSIYAKLEVSNRAQAIQRAQDLGL